MNFTHCSVHDTVAVKVLSELESNAIAPNPYPNHIKSHHSSFYVNALGSHHHSAVFIQRGFTLSRLGAKG